MITLMCLLAVLSMANCLEQLPTRQEIETSINRTIDEVERMVRDDPSLPRLSRSQIVDILFNITATDMSSYEESVEKTREDYQRALMVVLPYNSKDSKEENLKDLYTKKPLIQIVPDPSATPETINGEFTRTTIKASDNLINAMTKKSEESPVHYKNHRDTYTEVNTQLPTEESLRILLNDKTENRAPEKFSFDLQKLATTKENTLATRLPFFQNFPGNRAKPTNKSDLEIVYSTSVSQRPTTKIVETTTSDSEGFRPTMPPTKSIQNTLTSDQWRYNAPPSAATTKSRGPSVDLDKNLTKTTGIPFLPTMMTESGEKETKPSPTPKLEESTTPEISQRQKDHGFPWDMDNLRIVDENAKPLPLYVTPMSSTINSEKLELEAFPTTLSEAQATKASTPMREDVQELLASIGLRPNKDDMVDSTKNKLIRDHDKIFGSNFQIPNTNNVILGQASGLTAVGIESPSIRGQNTFEETPKDVKKGVDNLSPDVQLLFQRFGLQSSAKDREIERTKVTTEKSRILTTKTSFWNNFKPLPDSEVRDKGMKDFLAKFGLGVKETRNEKSMKPRKSAERKPPSMIEAVPVNMKRVLENIGLITRSQRPEDAKNIEQTETPQLHVFKPHETSFDNEKQRAKINELLDTVKMVQEGKADVVAVQKAARELLETTKSLKNGPDPLSLEEILKLYNDDVKNEIKRQENPMDLAEMATSEASDSSSTTSSPKEETASSDLTDFLGTPSDSSGSADTSNDAKNTGSEIAAATTENSNLDALADSFGGSTSAPDPVLPPARKTGLYFLVDWNTFLEVGEEGPERVNLRFQPKVGDRTRFLPITVP